MTSLDDYLAEASRQRWEWGRMDCVQFGLGWASARIGRPLPAPLAYRDAKAAKAFLEAHGGLLGVVSQWCEANGFLPTEEPEDGDIAVAQMAADREYAISGASLVIRCGPWWVGKALRGLASVPADGIPAWRIS